MKLIEFYPNGTNEKIQLETTYAQTAQSIRENTDLIRTTSMSHLSLTLIDRGYTVVIVGRRGQRSKIYPGVLAPNGRHIYHSTNIQKMLAAGELDRWFN